jgi:DNA-binding XRE family transcriptional regulator
MKTLTKDTIRDNVVSNFRHARVELGITVKEMAKYLGIHEKTLGAIENRGVSTPVHVYKLSKLINVTMDTIYTKRLNA